MSRNLIGRQVRFLALSFSQNSAQLRLFPHLTVPTASLPGSNPSPGHCQMVQRPEWLRIHQQVSKEPREGEERVSFSELACGIGHIISSLPLPRHMVVMSS